MTEQNELRDHIEAAHIHDDRQITEEELLTYHRGQMSEAEAQAFQDRLVTDSEALDALRALREMDPQGEATVNEAETRTAWAAFEERLHQPDPVAEVVPIAKPSTGIRVNWILAAACVLLVFWVVSREFSDRQPLVMDSQILRFDLASETRGADPIDRSADEWILEVRLSSGDLGRERYEVSLQTVAGEPLDRQRLVLRDDYLVYKPERALLVPDTLVMVCFGFRDGEAEELGRIPLRVSGSR